MQRSKCRKQTAAALNRTQMCILSDRLTLLILQRRRDGNRIFFYVSYAVLFVFISSFRLTVRRLCFIAEAWMSDTSRSSQATGWAEPWIIYLYIFILKHVFTLVWRKSFRSRRTSRVNASYRYSVCIGKVRGDFKAALANPCLIPCSHSRLVPAHSVSARRVFNITYHSLSLSVSYSRILQCTRQSTRRACSLMQTLTGGL